jgi:hypothetical protein
MGSSSIISLGLLIVHYAIYNSGNIIDGFLIYNIPRIIDRASDNCQGIYFIDPSRSLSLPAVIAL